MILELERYKLNFFSIKVRWSTSRLDIFHASVIHRRHHDFAFHESSYEVK